MPNLVIPDHNTLYDSQVVSVMSPNDFMDRTAVTVLLGFQLSKISPTTGSHDSSLKVCLVDCNLDDGDLGYHFEEKASSSSVSPIDSSSTITDEVLWNHLIYSEHLKAHVLCDPTQGYLGCEEAAEIYRNVILHLKTMFDVVILDASPHMESINESIVVPMADRILIVLNETLNSIASTQQLINAVAGLAGGKKIGRSDIGVILNNMMTPEMLTIPKVEAILGTDIIGDIPYNGDEFVLDLFDLNLEKMTEHSKVKLACEKMAEFALAP